MSDTKYHDWESLSRWERVLVEQLLEFTVNICARIGVKSNPERQAEQRSGPPEQSLQPGQSHPCEVSSSCLCWSHQPTALHISLPDANKTHKATVVVTEISCFPC